MISVIYSILLALEVLIIAAAVSNFVPYPPNPLYDHLFQRSLGSIFPNRDLPLYAVFLCACLLIQALMVFVFGNRLLQKDLTTKITQLSIAQAMWVVIEIFAAFKMYMYHGPLWAKRLFYGALVLSILNKVFWPEFYRWLERFYLKFFDLRHSQRASRSGDVVTMVLIVSVFWITDWNKCLASLAARDNFGQLQQFFNLTLWGKVFNLANAVPKEQISFMVAVHVLYFVGLYVLLRLWLKEKFLPVFGALMALKLQCFNEATMPLAWAQPQLTVLMHAWDVAFFVCLLFYRDTQKFIYVLGMTLVCALAIAFMPFSGFCLWLAYAAVMVVSLRAEQGNFSKVRTFGLAVLAAPLLGWGMILLLHGHWVWPHGTGVITQQLTDRHYFSFFFGFVVLATYAVSIWENESLWTLSLGIYGLLSFSQYALMAFPDGYYIYVLPFIMLMAHQITRVPLKKYFYVRLALAVLSIASLLTNSVFLLYPNIWRSIF